MKKMKKKMLAAVLAVGMILSLAACGNGGNSGGSNNASASGRLKVRRKQRLMILFRGLQIQRLKLAIQQLYLVLMHQ